MVMSFSEKDKILRRIRSPHERLLRRSRRRCADNVKMNLRTELIGLKIWTSGGLV
jgi:hypothetical protein